MVVVDLPGAYLTMEKLDLIHMVLYGHTTELIPQLCILLGVVHDIFPGLLSGEI